MGAITTTVGTIATIGALMGAWKDINARQPGAGLNEFATACVSPAKAWQTMLHCPLTMGAAPEAMVAHLGTAAFLAVRPAVTRLTR